MRQIMTIILPIPRSPLTPATQPPFFGPFLLFGRQFAGRETIGVTGCLCPPPACDVLLEDNASDGVPSRVASERGAEKPP